MSKFTPTLLAVLVLTALIAQACLPGASPSDENFVETAIAQTIVAGLTQTASAFMPSSTPTSTFTPEFPTDTPTPSLTPTPIFTSTPLVPQVSVSVNTNCRIGPGRVYDRVGYLLVGEVAELLGRDPTGNYWYIRNPHRGAQFCWLWGEYATLTGNTSVLPVFTPPPTPTPTPSPDFRALYKGKDFCTGTGWWVEVELQNTGTVAFKSISLVVRDTVTDVVLSLESNGFTNNDGCLTSNTRDELGPGITRIVSSRPFSYDPTGNRIRATITLCSERDLKGTCISDVIQFTP